ncbi:MAG: leucine-rich repeat domain-containing protein [Clostridiales bacterium]|nr:leucine-rich repeat domain-containing protein [Clostridiales bacterium]
MRITKKQYRGAIFIILMLAFCLLVNPICIGAAKSCGNTEESCEYKDEKQGVLYALETNTTCRVSKVSNKSKKINIPKEIKVRGKKYKVIGIDYNAFGKCSKLESVNISEGVREIGEYAFSKCTKLRSVNIPKSIRIIDKYAFKDCSSLQGELVIPKNVGILGKRPFLGCTKLKGLSVEEKNKNYSSDEYGNIYNKEKTLLIYGTPYARSVNIPEGVEKIDNYAFFKCNNLKLLTIPQTVIEIGQYAFSRCSSLEGKIVIPKSVKKLGQHLFWGCTNLKGLSVEEENKNYSSDECGNIYDKSKTSLIYGAPFASNVNIPEGVKKIGKYAFYKYDKLSSVNIPEGVEEIGPEAFSNCSKLSSVNIPKGVKEICTYAFHDCSQLSSASIAGEVICHGAFQGCSQLRNVNLSEGVKEIWIYAFSNCSKLKKINIPEGLEEIGEFAFENCSSLKGKIVIPKSVKVLDRGLFAGCNKLEGLSVAKENEVYCSDKYGNIYNKKKTKLIYGSPYAKEVIVSKGITELGEFAFAENSNLKSIKLPKGLAKIEFGAFRGCSKLESVNIPEGVEKIEVEAFSGCSSLRGKMVIPKSVKSIEAYSFQGCIRLKELSVAKGNKTYSSDKYGNIYDKKCITLLEGSPYASNVSIAKSVKRIDNSAFIFRSKLKSVKIPEGVKKIGGHAFYGCKKLSSVYIPSSMKKIGEEAFIGCNDNLVLHVKKGSFGEEYAKGWWKYIYF